MNSFVQLVCYLLLIFGLFDKSLTSVGNLQHVGCFDLNYALSMNYHRHIPDVNLIKCTTLCAYRNTKYAGIEKSDNFCYCGSDIAEASLKRNDTLCNVECPDNSTALCGGDWLMSVYLLSDFDTRDMWTPTTTPATTSQTEGLGFLMGVSVGTILLNSSSLSRYDTVMTTLDWVFSVDYHLSKNLAFAFFKKRIYKSTLDHKVSLFGTSFTIVRDVGKCDGFAVDWESDRIYWANCTTSAVTIMSCDLSGNTLSFVLRRPGDPVNVKNMVIDPYEKLLKCCLQIKSIHCGFEKGQCPLRCTELCKCGPGRPIMLFWTGDGVVESCTTSGSNFQTNLTNPETPVRSLSLDLPSRRFYYTSVDNESSALHSKNYAGSDPLMHFRVPQLKSVYGLGLFRGYVYWINFFGSRDVIYEAPLNFTNVEQVNMLKIVDRAVWHMKLVHPELQTRPSTNPCDKKGCSTGCVVLSLTPYCLCPQGFQLDNKGTTCINSTKNSQGLVQYTIKPDVRMTAAIERSADSQARTRPRQDHSKVLLVVFLVGTTILLVLGLLYFSNQHWPSIQAKLYRVPYRRQEQHIGDSSSVNPQYDTTEDNVNLV